MRKGTLSFVILYLLMLPAWSVRAGVEDSTVKKPRAVGIFPVPALGYSPETRWYAGAVALFDLRFLQKDSLSRVSSAKAEINYTQNKQLIAEIQWNAFSREGQWYHEGLLGYRKFPELFWGIGAHTPDSLEERYSARRVELDIRSLKALTPNSFLGLRFRMQDMFGMEVRQGGLLDSTGLSGANGSFSLGVGPAFLYDTRQNALNAQQGVFVSLSALHFSKALGSNYSFSRFEADTRTYLKWKKTIWAFQAYTMLQSGTPPFRMMALMGSDREMRGYYQGRYRDQNQLALQAEWRVPVKWGLGFVLFGGAGEVFRWNEPYRLEVFKYTAGAGLRVRVDKKGQVNMRFDYAMGHQTSGFYVAFAEAF